jgi:hypothetical protein
MDPYFMRKIFGQDLPLFVRGLFPPVSSGNLERKDPDNPVNPVK